jgi:DNA-binding HxlR family transcriptional regulator
LGSYAGARRRIEVRRGQPASPGHRRANGPADRDDRLPGRTHGELIGNRWTPLILRDLAGRCCRFSELERSLTGISPKTLSERLKRLEEAGIVERACFAEVPPRVQYSLTPKGHALLPVIDSMRDYGAPG